MCQNSESREDRFWAKEGRKALEEFRRSGPKAIPWEKVKERLFPAAEYARTSLVRKIIKARRQARLTQADLARRAAIRPETLNRIEKGKTTPNMATIAKIERALQADKTGEE